MKAKRVKGSVGEVKQTKRPKRPSMRVVNLCVRSLRSRELVRTSLRNQTVRHNMSFVNLTLVLSDLLGGSTSMDVDVECLHEITTGTP